MEETNDILFSKTVKAGQRIYYIDVKQNKNGDMYLSLTESKKINQGTLDNPHFTYEKHKLFLYREDFQKFQQALSEAVSYIESEKGEATERTQNDGEIHIDLEF